MIALFALAAAASNVPSNTPESVAIQAVHNFGSCVVSRTPEGAREVLALDYNSADYEKRMQRYIKGHDYCIPFDARMGAAGVLFAGAVAEALLKNDIKADQLPQRLAFDANREPIAARGPAEAMALCTVFEAPDTTARIFATDPATAEETESMKPLGTVLPKCLKKHMTLNLKKPALRSLLALAAWRIATTPKAAQ
jgi:hypothetical protein